MEVILGNSKNHPSCPHGPCLLFERYTADGVKAKRKFFACSACRDRSECSFFQWADEDMSVERRTLWEKINQDKKASYSKEEYMRKLQVFKSLPDDQRKYCKTCSLIVVDESEKHTNHSVIKNVSFKMLRQPSSLFEVHENKKVEAQYFFDENTINFFVSLLQNLGFSKLVSIGVPKIHEFVTCNENSNLASFFMDIDDRYMQFYNPDQFCHYNMFNNHFFEGKKSKQRFKDFLFEEPDKKVVVMLDPPFGGLVDAVSHTLTIINKWWQKKNNKSDEIVPMMWIFPYFHEGRIQKNLPFMKMMDYKVKYMNHKKFKKSKSKSSPVRVFTNIQPSRFILPSEEGYRFCDKCERYVSKENQHCLKCNDCTTKHGKTYHHCDYCQQCVKSSYVHCSKCNKCALVSQKDIETCQDCESEIVKDDKNQLEKCFKCKGIGHKRRNCPGGHISHFKRRKLKA